VIDELGMKYMLIIAMIF